MTPLPMPFLIEIGRCIAASRAAAGLSQRDVAARCGLTRSSIANIESGRQDTTVTRLILIAQAINVSPAYILTPHSPAHFDAVGRLAAENERLRERLTAAKKALGEESADG